MKRKLFTGAVIAICLSLIAYGTLAYFTAEDTARNVITSGGIEIQLREWADKEKTTPFPEDEVSGVMPGSEVSKIVEVKNIGESDAYIRVSVEKALALAEGREGGVDLSLVTLDFNTEAWTEADGYYYYNSPLKPNETTAPLFTAVSFSADMGNLYQNSSLTVNVTAEATQVANNGASALTANGWPQA